VAQWNIIMTRKTMYLSEKCKSDHEKCVTERSMIVLEGTADEFLHEVTLVSQVKESSG